MFCKAAIVSVIGWTTTLGGAQPSLRGKYPYAVLPSIPEENASSAEPPQPKTLGRAHMVTKPLRPTSASTEIDQLFPNDVSDVLVNLLDHPVSMSQDQILSNAPDFQTPSPMGLRALEKPLVCVEERRVLIDSWSAQQDVCHVASDYVENAADSRGSRIRGVPVQTKVLAGGAVICLVAAVVSAVLAIQSFFPPACSVLPTTGDLPATAGEPTTSMAEFPYSEVSLGRSGDYCVDETQVIRVMTRRCMPISLPANEIEFSHSLSYTQLSLFKDFDSSNDSMVDKDEFYRKLGHWKINGVEYTRPEGCPLTYNRAPLYADCLTGEDDDLSCSNSASSPGTVKYQDLLKEMDLDENGHLSNEEIREGMKCKKRYSRGYKLLAKHFLDRETRTFYNFNSDPNPLAEMVFDILSGSDHDKERLKLNGSIEIPTIQEIIENVAQIAPNYFENPLPRPTLHLKEKAGLVSDSTLPATSDSVDPTSGTHPPTSMQSSTSTTTEHPPTKEEREDE